MDKWFKDILPDKDPYHNRGRDQMRKKGGSGIRVPVPLITQCLKGYYIVYQLRNFFIPKIIVDFRTDLHKMKIKHRIIDEYASKRCFFD